MFLCPTLESVRCEDDLDEDQLAVSLKAREIALNGVLPRNNWGAILEKRVLVITWIQLVCLDAHFNGINDWNLEAVDRLLAPDCMGQKVVGSNPGASEDFSPQNS